MLIQNGDQVYCEESTGTADEKLTIIKLGPYLRTSYIVDLLVLGSTSQELHC